MNGSVRVVLGVLAVMAAPAAKSQAIEPDVEHAFDIALEPAKYVGKRYRIAGCLFRGVQIEVAVCEITRGSNVLGLVPIGYGRNDLPGRRWLIENCASPGAPRARCAVDIVADVRLDADGVVFANAAIIEP